MACVVRDRGRRRNVSPDFYCSKETAQRSLLGGSVCTTHFKCVRDYQSRYFTLPHDPHLMSTLSPMYAPSCR